MPQVKLSDNLKLQLQRLEALEPYLISADAGDDYKAEIEDAIDELEAAISKYEDAITGHDEEEEEEDDYDDDSYDDDIPYADEYKEDFD